MSDAFRALSDDEVRQINQIIESLDRSNFDFLQLEVGDVKLMLGRGVPPSLLIAAPGTAANPPISLPQPAPGAPAAPAPSAGNQAAVAAAPAPAAKDDAARKDTVAITAPLLGRFYAQPEPGASPYVSVGSQVTENTTVALIEVMKTFNAVPAGVAGVVTEICVSDATFVEYGQILFRVRPMKAAQGRS